MTPTQDSKRSPPTLRKPLPDEAETFCTVLSPLAAICRPPLDPEQVLGYFNALADLPPEAIFVAATEIAAVRQYPSWPMPGEIRTVAVRFMAPQVTAGEAWALAQKAARLLADPSIDFKNGKPVAEWNDQIFAALPPAVQKTLRIFGGRRILETQAVYANFRDEYERQVALIRRPLMLPAPAKTLIAGLLAKSDVARKLIA